MKRRQVGLTGLGVLLVMLLSFGVSWGQMICTGTIFNDVNEATVGLAFCHYIELFSALGITGGCSATPPLYCPFNPVTREQMAVFLTTTLDKVPDVISEGPCAVGQVLKKTATGFTCADDLVGNGIAPSASVSPLDGTSSYGLSDNYSRGDHRHGINPGAITNTMIGTGAVSTAKIGDGQVTNGKITGPIDGTKISSTGLNADTVDTKHASDFAPASHVHSAADINSGLLNLSGATGTGTSAIIQGTNTGAGYGVEGYSLSNYGVYGYSSAVPGVFGYSTADAGVEGINGNYGNYGLLGTNDYGVYGNSFSVNGYAGYFEGRTKVTGDLLVYNSTTPKRLGVGTETPAEDLHVKGSGYLQGVFESTDSSGGIQLISGKPSLIDPNVRYELQALKDGGFILYDRNNNRYVLKADATGKVGVGTTSPQQKLDVDGQIRAKTGYGDSIRLGGDNIGDDVEISIGAPESRNLVSFYNEQLQTGANIAVNGVRFPDGTRLTSYRGFPRPNFDSGWNTIAPDNEFTLTHNLGGDVNNYFVDLQFKSAGSMGSIHNRGMGVDLNGPFAAGAFYKFLTTTQITVHRASGDDGVDEFRVRIWVYE